MNGFDRSHAKLKYFKANHFHDNVVKNDAAAIEPRGCSDNVTLLMKR
jgi:hypothetical protein